MANILTIPNKNQKEKRLAGDRSRAMGHMPRKEGWGGDPESPKLSPGVEPDGRMPLCLS